MTSIARKTASLLLQATTLRPRIGVVLGSGFQGLAEAVQTEVEIPYSRLSGFLPSTVDGHHGKLIIGALKDTPLFVLCGRSHYYEGHSMSEITFPIRVLAECGVRGVVLTNAAGGINRKFRVGDFMGLTDHINLMGANPLRGGFEGGPVSFLDLSQTYDPALAKLLLKVARKKRIPCHAGVYAAVSGPTYETPAEIRAFARLGADAVGMSTVPEAVVARQCRLRVSAISCITNAAAGLSPQPLSHAEVLAAGRRVKSHAVALLTEFVRLAHPILAD